jgi:rare lipoprotein A (peptidoglycan hydrolase)
MRISWRLLVAIIIGAVSGATLTELELQFLKPRPQSEENASSTARPDRQENPAALRGKEPRQADKTVAGSTQPPQRDGFGVATQPPADKGITGPRREPQNEPVLVQQGSAAYYADKYQGRTTASGDPMDQNELIAAPTSRAAP